jgi:hypothetical protein
LTSQGKVKTKGELKAFQPPWSLPCLIWLDSKSHIWSQPDTSADNNIPADDNNKTKDQLMPTNMNTPTKEAAQCDPNTQAAYLCHTCQEGFDDKDSLMTHQVEEHHELYYCRCCNTQFTSSTDMAAHWRDDAIQTTRTSSDEDSPYKSAYIALMGHARFCKKTGHSVDTCPQQLFDVESKDFLDAFPEARKAFQSRSKPTADLASRWDGIFTEFIKRKSTQSKDDSTRTRDRKTGNKKRVPSVNENTPLKVNYYEQ